MMTGVGTPRVFSRGKRCGNSEHASWSRRRNTAAPPQEPAHADLIFLYAIALGYYHSMLRSVFGNVAMRVRRLRGCSCTGTQDRSYSALFINRNPITPELKYLTA